MKELCFSLPFVELLFKGHIYIYAVFIYLYIFMKDTVAKKSFLVASWKMGEKC